MNEIELSDAEFRRECPRAFVVTQPDEEKSVVVYARNAMEARREAHCVDDLGCSDMEDELLVRRAPEFDDLRGRTLKQAQWDEGWRFWCEHPGCPVERCEEGRGALVGDKAYCQQHAAQQEAVSNAK